LAPKCERQELDASAQRQLGKAYLSKTIVHWVRLVNIDTICGQRYFHNVSVVDLPKAQAARRRTFASGTQGATTGVVVGVGVDLCYYGIVLLC